MEKEIFTCIYCNIELSVKESSLEHVIPQFLGGNYSSNLFKTTDVCKACNNKLGLFVDASYAKSYFVTNYLASAARSFYTGKTCPPLPLSYMGTFSHEDIYLAEKQTIDNWLGPSGECVFWIRQKDERMYWYSGGNPTHRKTKTTAYLSLTDKPKTFELGIKSFLHKFKGKNIRKILCQEIIDDEGNSITLKGFDTPTEREKNISNKLLDTIFSKKIHLSSSIYTKFDSRFIAKLVLSIGYILFGEKFLLTKHALAARNDLWLKKGEEEKLPKTSSLLDKDDDNLKKIMSYPGANVISIINSGGLYYLNITVNGSMFSTTEFASAHLISPHIDANNGLVILLFPYLKLAIELNFFEFILHKNGSFKHAELSKIDEIIEKSKRYWEDIKDK